MDLLGRPKKLEKIYVNAIQGGDQVPVPASRRSWQLQSQGSSTFRVKKNTGQKELWNLPLLLQKSTEARSLAGESLQGGPERPLCETVKVKTGLHWKPQGDGDRDTRVIGYLPRIAADRVWNQPEREVHYKQQSWKRRAIY